MPRISSKPAPRSSSNSRNQSTTPVKSVTSVTPYHPPSVPAVYHPPQPTLLQSMKDGFGLGVGASIARNIVDRAFGSVATTATAAMAAPISSQPPKHEHDTKLYEQCIQNGATEEFCRQISEKTTKE